MLFRRVFSVVCLVLAIVFVFVFVGIVVLCLVVWLLRLCDIYFDTLAAVVFDVWRFACLLVWVRSDLC